jgi:ornithine cyclodeaminase/alanine dehydrogenase
VTALTARHFARPDGKIATFVGAGTQARVNLAALRLGFAIEEVRILSRTAQSAESFAEEVRDTGIAAHIVSDPRAALEGADLIISSVPGGPANKPFLDPAWVSRGSFVSAVDVGRSWLPGFEQFDRIVTDDREQAVVQHREGRMAFGGQFDTEIPELVAGARPGRETDDERIVIIHPGNIVGIFGITKLILQELGILLSSAA